MRTLKDRCVVENIVLEAQPGICLLCGEPFSVIRHRERYVETFQGVGSATQVMLNEIQ
ncbi:MAG: hypothetical protein GY750_21155 [Lentisphaerae bacterium]|nr:hypothetical protein [Lentisphaerota bacterium]